MNKLNIKGYSFIGERRISLPVPNAGTLKTEVDDELTIAPEVNESAMNALEN